MLRAFNCRLLSTATPGRHRVGSRPPPAVAALWSDDRLTSEVLKPSKSSSKRKAEHLRSLARELVKLGPRQLQAVSPVLETDAELLEAISTAKGITPTNQGRKRQEGYIGKLLMSLSSEQQEEIDRQLNGMRKKSDRT